MVLLYTPTVSCTVDSLGRGVTIYEDKIHNEIEIKLKNTVSKIKKFKLEHPNNFAFLENQQDTESNLTSHNVKVEPSSLGQFKELI